MRRPTLRTRRMNRGTDQRRNPIRRDPTVTSRMMAAVRDRNSKAELALRRELHSHGVRYRLHARDVPGRPDIVWRGRKIAVFVDGDMWHGHAWKVRGLAKLEDMFPTNTEWWVSKIRRNEERDREVNRELRRTGWRVVRLWESDVLASPSRAGRRVMAVLREADANSHSPHSRRRIAHRR